HYANRTVLLRQPNCQKIHQCYHFLGSYWYECWLTAGFFVFIPKFNGRYFMAKFRRLRPLHTNAVIFAFVGNAIFAGVYYSSQRLLKARMWSDFLSNLNFWGWQAIIVGAAITLPLGYTTSKEYAELEWPFDIAIAVIWV